MNDVYEEVAKTTDYTGSKLVEGDKGARDRILAADEDLEELGRFWEESILATNESLKEMLVSGTTILPDGSNNTCYEIVLEVSKSFDKMLTESVRLTLRSFFIMSIIGQWFKFANKGEAQDYFLKGAELMETARRLLYSRRKPTLPQD